MERAPRPFRISYRFDTPGSRRSILASQRGMPPPCPRRKESRNFSSGLVNVETVSTVVPLSFCMEISSRIYNDGSFRMQLIYLVVLSLNALYSKKGPGGARRMIVKITIRRRSYYQFFSRRVLLGSDPII